MAFTNHRALSLNVFLFAAALIFCLQPICFAEKTKGCTGEGLTSFNITQQSKPTIVQQYKPRDPKPGRWGFAKPCYEFFPNLEKEKVPHYDYCCDGPCTPEEGQRITDEILRRELARTHWRYGMLDAEKKRRIQKQLPLDLMPKLNSNIEER